MREPALADAPGVQASASGREAAWTAGVFLLAFWVFWASPHRALGDYQYSMLLSQSLLEHSSFALERYFPGAGWADPARPWVGAPWQLFSHTGHVYHFFPPGPSVLCVPLVALCRLFGWSATGPQGAYDFAGEMQIQGFVAAVLMAALTAVFYASGRLLLPRRWSLLAAFGAAFGTSIWSTASRGVWGHTGEILVLGGLIHTLLAHAARGRPLRAGLLGLLAGTLYTMRPTGSISLALVGLYLLWRGALPALRYAAGAAVPLALLALWSRVHFGLLQPPYYRQSSLLDLANVAQGTLGTLLSPSRGLLIFSPVLLWVAAVLILRRKELVCAPLAGLALAVVAVLQVPLSLWPCWWGGQCYGARLSTSQLPWLVLLAMLALRAELSAAGAGGLRPSAGIGAALLAASVLMNAPGALTPRVHSWNQVPFNVDFWPEQRLWDWRRPQVLAAFGWPLDRDFPAWPAGRRLLMRTEAAVPYLWGGWSDAEQGRRWTTWRHSDLLFTWTPGQAALLRFRAEPWPAADGSRNQRLEVFVNHRRLRKWLLRQPVPRQIHVTVPGHFLQERNVLRFQTPDAVPFLASVPRKGVQHRGVGVWWVELHPAGSGE